jgi:acetyl-CoA C-acetyltransferase
MEKKYYRTTNVGVFFMRDVALIGLGLTRVNPVYEKSIRDLFNEAASRSLDDAGNPEVESVYIGNMAADEFSQQKDLASLLADFAGLDKISATRIETGAASGGSAVIAGFNDVASGLHDIVLVGGVEKMSETISSETEAILSLSMFQEYETMHGLSLPGAAAMIMRLYMHKYKVKHEDIAYLAVQDHKNAVKNPYAQLPFEISVDKVIKSRPIADPITMLDCAPVGDGAAAVILCSLDKARKYTDQPILIKGVGQASDTLGLGQRKNLLSLDSVKRASEQAYKMAKIKSEDIQLAEIFDPYTIMGILALEDLGFSERGKTAELLTQNYFSREGLKPINISGGLKARGHPVGATGVYQVAEVAMVLRGESQLKLDKDVKTGLAQSTSGTGSLSTVEILEKV